MTTFPLNPPLFHMPNPRAHCFVSATSDGSDMWLDLLERDGLARLLEARVANVTVTGGELLVHPHLVEILELLTGEGHTNAESAKQTALRRENVATGLGRMSSAPLSSYSWK